jgi:uncharacterized protein (TIGR03435 family)
MLRALLADRFKLAIHKESREVPTYELVISKNGPKIKEGKPDDPTLPNGTLRVMSGKITGNAVSMARLASVIGMQLKHPVVDRTGLMGTYDFSLGWQPEEDPSQTLPGAEGSQQGSLPKLDSSGPSIFTALQEQLGLKLESTKDQVHVDIVVIDHIELPSEN